MTQAFLASTLLAAATALVPTSAAFAQDEAGWEFDGVPSWSNPETGDSFTFRGRVFLDYGDVEFDTAGATASWSDSEIRTARLGVTGSFSGVGYVAEFDWINESIAANDVYLTFEGSGFELKLGHMKTPNSIGTDLFALYQLHGARSRHGPVRSGPPRRCASGA